MHKKSGVEKMVRMFLVVVLVALVVATFVFAYQGRAGLASITGLLAGVPAFGFGFFQKPLDGTQD